MAVHCLPLSQANETFSSQKSIIVKKSYEFQPKGHSQRIHQRDSEAFLGFPGFPGLPSGSNKTMTVD